jgi:protein-L-isoaspartate(D-aspartate) O-methyltransferase
MLRGRWILLAIAIAVLGLTAVQIRGFDPVQSNNSQQQAILGNPFVRQEKFSKLREEMVTDQIANRDVRDTKVLEAMRKVPRHLFVPENYVDAAYDDGPLPIGYGQTISQPYIVALMTELAGVSRSSRVLEVGTGSGYQAAVLAEIVDKVHTIEVIKELGDAARERLKTLGYANIEVRIGDGYYGWEEYAPFDAIIVTAAAEHVPPPLIRQLKEGGKIIIPIGHAFWVQDLVVVAKKGDRVTTKNIIPVRFVPLTGEH